MHDFTGFILPAAISAAFFIGTGIYFELRSRRANRRTVSNNLALAVARSDRGRHAKPRPVHYFGADAGPYGDGHGNGGTSGPVNGRPGPGPVRIFRTRVGVPAHVQRSLVDSAAA